MTASSAIDRLLGILAALRAPDTGCPWDREQTHDSLAPFAIEEAYELADAIARGDHRDLRDELGDCLLQVVFHARVAEEAGRFSFADVVEAICGKLLRRHPHVFSREPREGVPSGGSGGIDEASWEAAKAAERIGKGQTGLLADVPTALPGLTRAVKLQRRAASVGFDWSDAGMVVAKVREEIDEAEAEIGGDAEALREEIGDLLFAVANLARHAAVDPEAALRGANRKFERRFGFIESALAAKGSSPGEASLDEMEALWGEAKRSEKQPRR